ncbi:SDR family oxidoreductase [Mycobacterium sp. AT1]|uniref:SDR family oxidoreductase n=1 Tax=Mycobacterium sp. AT1 TaxID=1961706 RepID=UPI0009AE390C|nr:SDR family oxidoreductase [Mycobacterium sp. AT1]OPX07700.1 short-chain dehydrogenase [Mycobacterium sp. AT1]
MGSMDGKNALVTGGTAGIGLASAVALAEAGAHVFLTGRNQDTIDAAVASIGSSATGIRSDVSDPAQLDAIVDAITAHGGGLDAVFTNAGGGEFATLEEVTVEHYLDTFNRNVAGTMFTVQKVLPLLNDGASVILSGSTSASRGIPSFGVYAASKAAVRSFGRTWAAELAPRGIRVNTLVPGPVETPGLVGLAPAGGEKELLKNLTADVTLGRIGQPNEIGAAVVFLASPASSFMTGSEMFVDGGEVQT